MGLFDEYYEIPVPYDDRRWECPEEVLSVVELALEHDELPDRWPITPAEARVRCCHPHSELRLRVLSNGARSYWRQCLWCGNVVGQTVSRVAASQEYVGVWNEMLRRAWWKNQRTILGAPPYNEWVNPKNPRWKRRCDAVRQRAGNRCEICHRWPVQHVHHTTYDNLGHEPLRDLLGLCLPCHADQHPENQELRECARWALQKLRRGEREYRKFLRHAPSDDDPELLAMEAAAADAAFDGHCAEDGVPWAYTLADDMYRCCTCDGLIDTGESVLYDSQSDNRMHSCCWELHEDYQHTMANPHS